MNSNDLEEWYDSFYKDELKLGKRTFDENELTNKEVLILLSMHERTKGTTLPVEKDDLLSDFLDFTEKIENGINMDKLISNVKGHTFAKN